MYILRVSVYAKIIFKAHLKMVLAAILYKLWPETILNFTYFNLAQKTYQCDNFYIMCTHNSLQQNLYRSRHR